MGKLMNRVSEVAGSQRMQVADLAREAKISWETANRLWYDETKSIRFETLARLCEVLNCEPGDLFAYMRNGDNNA